VAETRPLLHELRLAGARRERYVAPGEPLTRQDLGIFDWANPRLRATASSRRRKPPTRRPISAVRNVQFNNGIDDQENEWDAYVQQAVEPRADQVAADMRGAAPSTSPAQYVRGRIA
jgi:hypothetical protein